MRAITYTDKQEVELIISNGTLEIQTKDYPGSLFQFELEDLQLIIADLQDLETAMTPFSTQIKRKLEGILQEPDNL